MTDTGFACQLGLSDNAKYDMIRFCICDVCKNRLRIPKW